MAFAVTKLSESFVAPSEPTPSETLNLSFIDRVPGLRHQVRSLHVFEHGDSPAKVIQEALSKVLVPYYPFAGRFIDGGETAVECTGEGAWFVEATADCRLEDVKFLSYPLMIPQEELLPQATLEFDPLNVPLMMQVTEFKCGGFSVGIAAVHTITDGLGAAQFVNAIAELARGIPRPTVTPVWSRHLIPNPPRAHLPPGGPPPVSIPSLNLKYSAFDLPAAYIAHIKSAHFSATGRHCSTFDISTAKAWQARIRAISPGAPDELVSVCFFASTRHLLTPVAREDGFYGNCFYPVAVTAPSSTVVNSEVLDIVRLIRDAKARLPGEFKRWANGELFAEDPYELSFTYRSLFVSDWTRLGLLEADYGWGKPMHIVPFAYYDFMAVAIFGAPTAPKKGVRAMTQCVETEHLPAFEKEMECFAS